MTDDQIKVISALAASGSEWVDHATHQSQTLGMDHSAFLRVCRELRDLGYAKLTTLFDDEYRPHGSAYVRTDAGDALVLLARKE